MARLSGFYLQWKLQHLFTEENKNRNNCLLRITSFMWRLVMFHFLRHQADVGDSWKKTCKDDSFMFHGLDNLLGLGYPQWESPSSTCFESVWCNNSSWTTPCKYGVCSCISIQQNAASNTHPHTHAHTHTYKDISSFGGDRKIQVDWQ